MRVAGEDVRGPYSLGNREEGARGWSGGEPGKRGRGRGGLWGCVGEDAGKRGRARKLRERAQERGRGCGRVARVREGTGRECGQGLRRLSIRRGK